MYGMYKYVTKSVSIEWDLKNKNGDMVVPGMYIFVIEAGDLDPRLGKFVIIK